MLRSATLANLLRGSSARLFSETAGTPASPPPPSPPTARPPPETPGLSEACIAKANAPVGPDVDPGKSGPYKVPEYFCYNTMSYFEAEIEMAKYRLPQPNANKK